MFTGSNAVTFELLFEGDKHSMIERLYLYCLDKNGIIINENHKLINKYLPVLTDKNISNSKFIAIHKYLEEVCVKNGGGLC